jgi:hypothetical protein
MAWVAADSSNLTKPLVRQILAIINRDCQAALDWASGAPGSLQPFVEYDMALMPVQQFPALLLAPEGDSFDVGSPDTDKQTVRMYCSLAVTHQDRNALAERVQDYVKAVREILKASWFLTAGDFYSTSIAMPSPPFLSTETSPGLNPGALKDLFVSAAAYDEMRRNAQSGWMMSATMAIQCEMEES